MTFKLFRFRNDERNSAYTILTGVEKHSTPFCMIHLFIGVQCNEIK